MLLKQKKPYELPFEYKGPVYIKLGRPKIPVITDEKLPFIIGKADILTLRNFKVKLRNLT